MTAKIFRLGFCWCGCGEEISIRPISGQAYLKRYKNGHQGSARSSTGITIRHGYRYISTPGHPKAEKKGNYVAEHVLVMEAFIGRYLTDDEIVHHINEDKLDNRIENLQLMTNAAHVSFHHLGKTLSIQHKQKISDAHQWRRMIAS